MSTPAATLARMARVPEWLRVPSPMFWIRCGSATKGDRPIQGTPSAPMGVGGSFLSPAWRGSKYMIPWQPTPPPTSAPTGATVERLCGQPLQKAGGPGAAPRAAGSAWVWPARVRAGPPARAAPGRGWRPPRPRPARPPTRPAPGRHRSRLPTTGTGLRASCSRLRTWRLDERPLLLDDHQLVHRAGELRPASRGPPGRSWPSLSTRTPGRVQAVEVDARGRRRPGSRRSRSCPRTRCRGAAPGPAPITRSSPLWRA